MDHDINALTQERINLIETNEWNDATEARLLELEFILNQHHKRDKIFFRNGMDYIQSSPAMVGRNISQSLKDGQWASVFFSSHVEIGADTMMSITPCDNYDYANEEHQKMMLEKYVITLKVNSKYKITDNDFDVSAQMSFSYYEHNSQREMNLDIYVGGENKRWFQSGINWSAMGTCEPRICDTYANMMRMAVDIHRSITSECRKIAASLPKPLDNPPQS